MISVWSGREAHALREAMRMSIDDFALRARVSRRSVAKWSVRGSDMRLRWDVQRNLDRLLASSGRDVHDRLRALLASPDERSDRRSLRPGSTATGHRAGDALDLITTLVNPPDPAEGFVPPALIHLERAVAKMRMGYQACRYLQTLGELPALMRLLLQARASSAVTFPERVRKLAAETYHVTTGLLLKLDDLPLAMLAAQRCSQEAQASGQPLIIATGERATVRVLLRSGHPDSAAALARRAAARVAVATGLDGPRPLSAYGALLLRGAMAHARLGDRVQANASLHEASDVAGRLGRDGNFGWTAFGPTNVLLHRMAVLLELGDPGAALRVAQDIDPARILQVERQAAYYMSTAKALHQLGRHLEAAEALRHVAAIAPDEVSMRAATRRLAEKLKVAVPLGEPIPAPSVSRQPQPHGAAAA